MSKQTKPPTKGLAALKLDPSLSKSRDVSPAPKTPKAGMAPAKKPAELGVTIARRRLSVMGGDKCKINLDGASDKKSSEPKDSKESGAASPKTTKPFTKFAALSKVGYVPFNPNKVNQDRSCEVVSLGGDDSKAVFGVFDGHGYFGHDVSAFVSSDLPACLAEQPNLATEPHAALTKAFLDCNAKLSKDSHTDCSYSGTTAIVVYLHGKTLYTCNAGDSRAVLARRDGGAPSAVELSSDHKPDRPDERKRIIDCKGRVEPCKGMAGEDIGPPRVWLMNQDVPGLAMTRAFGDLVAATVGVTAKPEITERALDAHDAFVVLASDGIWEFISSQEAVEIVAGSAGPEDACRLLVDEATARWEREEEVIDDITCVVVYFQ